MSKAREGRRLSRIVGAWREVVRLDKNRSGTGGDRDSAEDRVRPNRKPCGIMDVKREPVARGRVVLTRSHDVQLCGSGPYELVVDEVRELRLALACGSPRSLLPVIRNSYVRLLNQSNDRKLNSESI